MASASAGASSPVRALASTVRASTVLMPSTPSRLALSVMTSSRPRRVSAVSGTAGISGKIAISAADPVTSGRSRQTIGVTTAAASTSPATPNANRRAPTAATIVRRFRGAGDVASPSARATAISLAVWKRSAGSLASARATAWSTCTGTSGRTARSGGGCSWRCLASTARVVGAVNGGMPASISYSTHPNE